MKTLEMVFKLDNGTAKTSPLTDPKDGLTKAEVETVMQKIIDEKAIVNEKGAVALSIKDAYVKVSERQELAV